MSSSSRLNLRVAAVGCIVFVRWTHVASLEDTRAAGDAILTARRTAGRALILVAILPPGFKLPSRAVLDEIYRFLPTIEHACESQYAVLLGDTIADAILRGGISVFAAVARQPVTVVSSVEAAVRLASTRLGLDHTAVLAEARASGVLEPS